MKKTVQIVLDGSSNKEGMSSKPESIAQADKDNSSSHEKRLVSLPKHHLMPGGEESKYVKSLSRSEKRNILQKKIV